MGAKTVKTRHKPEERTFVNATPLSVYNLSATKLQKFAMNNPWVHVIREKNGLLVVGLKFFQRVIFQNKCPVRAMRHTDSCLRGKKTGAPFTDLSKRRFASLGSFYFTGVLYLYQYARFRTKIHVLSFGG